MIWVNISTTVAGFTELNSVQLVIIRKKKRTDRLMPVGFIINLRMVNKVDFSIKNTTLSNLLILHEFS